MRIRWRVKLEREPSIRVSTAKGSVRAKHVVLAGDALLHGLEPRVNSRIMPVGNYIVATEPLEGKRNVIPANVAVSDTRFVVNYYRMSADGRLLFGGGERYTPSPPADIAGFVRPHMEKTFPQLKGCRIDHAWGGLVSVTTSRLPHVGHYGEVYFAHGYSGKGVILSTLSGKLLAEAITGDASRLRSVLDAEPDAVPGRHGAARSALCARHAVVRDARPHQALRSRRGDLNDEEILDPLLASSSAGRISRSISATENRADWVETLIAATVLPARSRIGTAIERRPSSSSSSTMAKPSAFALPMASASSRCR